MREREFVCFIWEYDIKNWRYSAISELICVVSIYVWLHLKIVCLLLYSANIITFYFSLFAAVVISLARFIFFFFFLTPGHKIAAIFNDSIQTSRFFFYTHNWVSLCVAHSYLFSSCQWIQFKQPTHTEEKKKIVVFLFFAFQTVLYCVRTKVQLHFTAQSTTITNTVFTAIIPII